MMVNIDGHTSVHEVWLHVRALTLVPHCGHELVGVAHAMRTELAHTTLSRHKRSDGGHPRKREAKGRSFKSYCV